MRAHTYTKFIQPCTRVHVHTHIHTHIHTRTHTRTHTPQVSVPVILPVLPAGSVAHLTPVGTLASCYWMRNQATNPSLPSVDFWATVHEGMLGVSGEL